MPRLFSTYDEAWAHFQGVAQMESFPDQYAEAEAHLLTWYLRVPATAAPGIVELQRELAALDGLVPIPADRLHVSVAPATVTDRVEPDLEAELLGLAGKAWAGEAPFDIGIGGLNVFPTAVVAEVEGGGPAHLLDRLLEAGHWESLPRRAPDRGVFLPHLTVAIATERRPAGPVRDVAAAHRHDRFGTVHVDEVQLCRVPVSRGRLLQPWHVAGSVYLATK